VGQERLAEFSRVAEAQMRMADLEAQLSGRATNEARFSAELAQTAEHMAALRARLAEASDETAGLKNELARARARAIDLETTLAARVAAAVHHDAELVRTRLQAGQLARVLDDTQRNLQWMLASTSWRLTRPIRRLATGSPKLARYGRQFL